MDSKNSEHNLGDQMTEVYAQEKQDRAIIDALQDLAEAGHDYIEAEQDGSGQGSWGKAMAWQVLKDKYAAAKALIDG